MKQMRVLALALLLVFVLGLWGCGGQETPEEPQTGEETWEAPDDALVSVKRSTAPNLDGVGDDEAWNDAPETIISVTEGANESETEVIMKSVYTDDSVSFLVTWEDPTQSFLRSPWEKQGGSWKQLTDPNDKGGDNNQWYEDKFSMIWPIDNSIEDFAEDGCQAACHLGEDSDIKPYGNKYTESEGETGDIWHWKSVRNVNQIDDQYLDSTKLDEANLEETREAGRHSDPNDGGGYVDNKTEDGKLPAFMLPDGAKKDGSPGFILDSEKVPFKDTGFADGDRIPSVVVAETTGDRADISAGWKYADGKWTLEFTRDLTTGSENDVQFGDLEETYYFGTAVFDNAQVRHAFQDGATPFVFQPEE